MEALQMLKFYFKKERLNFTDAWATTEKEMTDDDPDIDLLGVLLQGNSQDSLDHVMNYINQREE